MGSLIDNLVIGQPKVLKDEKVFVGDIYPCVNHQRSYDLRLIDYESRKRQEWPFNYLEVIRRLLNDKTLMIRSAYALSQLRIVHGASNSDSAIAFRIYSGADGNTFSNALWSLEESGATFWAPNRSIRPVLDSDFTSIISPSFLYPSVVNEIKANLFECLSHQEEFFVSYDQVAKALN
jgi:hypothetical protein